VQRLHLSAGTRGERRGVTTQLLDAVGRVGAVEDARQHSDKEIAIRFSLAAGGAAALQQALTELPPRLSEASAAELDAVPRDEEATGRLVVTFVHEEPELRVTAPAVPG
jgi:hypothetical protein